MKQSRVNTDRSVRGRFRMTAHPQGQLSTEGKSGLKN